jgi:hypothetical protein
MWLTLAAYWIAASYVLGVALAADQLRRPREAWESAGRDRRFWVVLSCAMGFHGLGEYAAVAYLVGVVPRFGTARGRVAVALQHTSDAVMRRWNLGARHVPRARADSTVEAMALVAALLVFVSSLIHSALIDDHWHQYWLYGAFFALVTFLQAIWAVLVLGDPLNQRVLIAGAAGNALLIVIWAVSRSVGVPIGPENGHPEAIGVLDVLSKLDELVAIVLVGAVLVFLRGPRRAVTPLQVRVGAMLAGPLFLYSILAAFGGGGHHH